MNKGYDVGIFKGLNKVDINLDNFCPTKNLFLSTSITHKIFPAEILPRTGARMSLSLQLGFLCRLKEFMNLNYLTLKMFYKAQEVITNFQPL